MKWLVCLFILMLSINAFAIYVPVVIPPQDNTNYNELGGCKAPIDFAIKNNCVLEKDGKYAVNTYTCGKWALAANCDGNVYALKETFFYQNRNILGILLIIVPFSVIIVSIIMFLKKDMGRII